MDFKDCKGMNYEKIERELNYVILNAVREFSYLQKSSIKYKDVSIGKEYTDILENTRKGNFSGALKQLSELLYLYHGKRVWILIDEYDAAINQAYLKFKSDEEADRVSELFREVYEKTLKTNDYL